MTNHEQTIETSGAFFLPLSNQQIDEAIDQIEAQPLGGHSRGTAASVVVRIEINPKAAHHDVAHGQAAEDTVGEMTPLAIAALVQEAFEKLPESDIFGIRPTSARVLKWDGPDADHELDLDYIRNREAIEASGSVRGDR
jgi:hypothetical protein